MDLTTLPGYVPGFRDELNLRDLGGQVSADGRRVRQGLLFRGSPLLGLTDAEKQRVDELGLRFMLDLRAKGEATGKDDYIPAGTTYVREGGMRDEDGSEVDFSPEGMEHITQKFEELGEAFMLQLYGSMLHNNQATHLLMDHFVAGNAPLYFHCSAGKDRTGVEAAILLMALGVDDEAIVAEYMLTNVYRANIINNAPAGSTPEEAKSWARMNSVEEEALRYVLAELDATHPSREAYFYDEFGLDSTALAALRDHYLE